MDTPFWQVVQQRVGARHFKPRSDFERKVALEAPAFVSLARRLVDDTLTKNERELLERTSRHLTLSAQGMKPFAIAMELGIGLAALDSFTHRGTYRTMSQFIRERETSTDGKVQETRAQNERARFEALGPKALDFLEHCLSKDEKGKFKSNVDAKWATGIVAKGKGWDEREDGRRRLGDIKIGVIMAQQQAIRTSDGKRPTLVVEARGRRVEVPLTPDPTPAEAKCDELHDLLEEDGEVEIADEEEAEVTQIPEP